VDDITKCIRSSYRKGVHTKGLVAQRLECDLDMIEVVGSNPIESTMNEEYSLDYWPQYHCKMVMHWASNPCESCDAMTNWLYWTKEYDSEIYVWHYFCVMCQKHRKDILEEFTR
jgi:hypothetical protein